MKKTISMMMIVCLLMSAAPLAGFLPGAGALGRVFGSRAAADEIETEYFAADARYVLRLSVGLSEAKEDSEQFRKADFDQNGAIEAVDAWLIYRKAVGLDTDDYLDGITASKKAKVSFVVGEYDESDGMTTVDAYLEDCVGLVAGSLTFSAAGSSVSKASFASGADAKEAGELHNPCLTEFNPDPAAAKLGFFFPYSLLSSAQWKERAEDLGMDGVVNGEKFHFATFRLAAEGGNAVITVKGKVNVGRETVPVAGEFRLNGLHTHQWDDGMIGKATDKEGEMEVKYTCPLCGAEKTVLMDIGPLLRGDVDGDGEVTSGGARLALRASVKLEKFKKGSVPFFAADADRDGVIEASDARVILRTSVKLETPEQ